MPVFHLTGETPRRIAINPALAAEVVEDDAKRAIIYIAAPEVSLVDELDDKGNKTGRKTPAGGLYWVRVNEEFDTVVKEFGWD